VRTIARAREVSVPGYAVRTDDRCASFDANRDIAAQPPRAHSTRIVKLRHRVLWCGVIATATRGKLTSAR
jgi:hypothetical protein